MKSKACFLLAVVLGASSGCKNWFPAGSAESPASVLEPEYAAGDLDSLIRYGENLTKMSLVQRLAECRRLQGMGSESRIGYRLHLLMVELLVPDCGDPQATAAALRSTEGEALDRHVDAWLSYLLELDGRVRREGSERAALEKRLKLGQVSEQRARREIKARERQIQALEAQVRELQSKLEALKSIEKKL
ncbi:MAG TPA: surface-like protein [Methylococcus sp.]|nr:surface-like protein [Methylococcus sp.]